MVLKPGITLCGIEVKRGIEDNTSDIGGKILFACTFLRNNKADL